MNSNILLSRSQRLLLSSVHKLTYQGVRCAGSKHGHDAHGHDSHGHGHGHDDHHHEHHHRVHSKSLNTSFQVPTQHDVDHIMAQHGNWYTRLAQWVYGRWQPDRDNLVYNNKVNKYSAYYWFGNYSILQNKMLLNVVRALFDESRTLAAHQNQGLAGVKTNENGIFLYRSDEADSALRHRATDYVALGMFGALVTGQFTFAYIPIIYLGLQLPRQLAVLQNFTFHAELLPHTEQVVFHKASYFGNTRRIYVDIKNLEKVDSQTVGNKLLWTANKFDQEMVFRDSESREVFVFDKDGIWNSEAVNHPLLN